MAALSSSIMAAAVLVATVFAVCRGKKKAEEKIDFPDARSVFHLSVSLDNFFRCQVSPSGDARYRVTRIRLGCVFTYLWTAYC